MLSLVIIILIYFTFNIPKIGYGHPRPPQLAIFDILERLESQVNFLNRTIQEKQVKIDSLGSIVFLEQHRHKEDFQAVAAVLNILEVKVDNLNQQANDSAALITLANEQLEDLELQVANQILRTNKIDAINKLWKSNFQVVNRTFAELRSKLAIVVRA